MDIKEQLQRLRGSITTLLNTFTKYISTYVAEIFVIFGALFIMYATFKINEIAGNYVTGIILLSIGIFLANTRR